MVTAVTFSISGGSSPSLMSTMRAFPWRSVSRISEAISRTFCFSKMLALDPIHDRMVCRAAVQTETRPVTD